MEGDGGYGDLMKVEGRKRRKIARTEKVERARCRAIQKLGDEQAADVVAVFRKASDGGDKEQTDGIIMSLLAQALSQIEVVALLHVGGYRVARLASPLPMIPIPRMESGMTCHALRLRPGEELKSKLLEYVQDHSLKAAFILSCVGSLRKASVRMVDSVTVIDVDKNHEIISLVGTLSGGHGHLHISLSDEKGKVFGGHLMGNAEVFTTAEVVLGELPQLEFCREPDPETGYSELAIHKRSSET